MLMVSETLQNSSTFLKRIQFCDVGLDISIETLSQAITLGKRDGWISIKYLGSLGGYGYLLCYRNTLSSQWSFSNPLRIFIWMKTNH